MEIKFHHLFLLHRSMPCNRSTNNSNDTCRGLLSPPTTACTVAVIKHIGADKRAYTSIYLQHFIWDICRDWITFHCWLLRSKTITAGEDVKNNNNESPFSLSDKCPVLRLLSMGWWPGRCSENGVNYPFCSSENGANNYGNAALTFSEDDAEFAPKRVKPTRVSNWAVGSGWRCILCWWRRSFVCGWEWGGVQKLTRLIMIMQYSNRWLEVGSNDWKGGSERERVEAWHQKIWLFLNAMVIR